MVMPPADRIENLRQRIAESDQLSEEDRDTLRWFDDGISLHRSKIGDYRHEKLLRHCVIIGEQVGGLSEALEDRPASEDIVRWIHREYSNPETNADYRKAVRALGRFATDEGGDDPPESIDWISSETSNDYDPTPDPSKMYWWDEHVLPMLDACFNTRDRAVLALQWDAGLRSGELHNRDDENYLELGRITDSTHGLQVTVEGKRGRRSPTLIPSVPYVNKWLAEHPRSGDPGAPFVASLSDGEPVSNRMYLDIFNNAAERAEMTPPSKATPTRFRKSSASYLASMNVSQTHLENRYGWVRGSRHAARYIAVFGDATEREVARAHGLDVSEGEKNRIAPFECPRCGQKTPREKELCVWCGQALEPGAAEKADALDDLIVQSIAEVSNENAARLLEFRDHAKNNPELRAEAIAEIEGLLNR